MNTRNIYAVIALIVGIPVAVFLGVSAAQDQVETVLWIGGIGFFIFCVAMGRHIWVLLPASLGLKGNLNCLPGAPAPWHLMMLVVAGFFVLRIATRQQRFRFQWTGMEIALLLVGLTLLQAFARNPTGFAIFGGDVAGGKPYFVFGGALVSFVLVGSADADIKSWRWAVAVYIVLSVFDGISAAVSDFIPQYGEILLRFYSNVNLDATMIADYTADLTDIRISKLAQIGSVLGLVACTFWRPVAALDVRKPWRAVIAGVAVVSVLLSGYRSAIARLGVNFICGSLIRRKPLDVIVVGFLGCIGLFGVIAGGMADELPFGIQRALSFIPGVRVRGDVAANARSSSEVRFEMWKEVAFSDHYISNKLLGDGFQISAAEQAARMAYTLGDARMRSAMTGMDLHLASGTYHGFHVETVRFTGVVGLIAATIALVIFAVYAWRLIQRYRNKQYWGYVLFVCMPYIIYPLWYWLVFGSYRSDFPKLIVFASLIALLYRIRENETPEVSEPALTPVDTEAST